MKLFEYVSSDLIPYKERRNRKYGRFIDNYTKIDSLLSSKTDLTNDFIVKLILACSEYKIRWKFKKYCERSHIKVDDEISKKLEEKVKNELTDTGARIEIARKKQQKEKQEKEAKQQEEAKRHEEDVKKASKFLDNFKL